jgi:DNA-binding beta-propeller fold protein YncE
MGLTARVGVLIGVCAAIIVGAASSARAADRVYWGNGTGISFANLDGSGGGDLDLTGATATQQAFGLAVDSAAGRIYWASAGDFGAVRVSFANLNGSGGGGGLNITGATASEPGGLAIDPVARRVYWANTNARNATLGTISRANLDGSGGGDLNTAGTATGCGVNPPPDDGPCKALGLAVDPALGKIYWSDFGAVNKISFAKLDGSGGSDLKTTGATVSDPEGVAIDTANGKVYWANEGANKISFANLDNTGGGGDLTIPAGATLNEPAGVAIDAAAGKIYWANGGPGTTDANSIAWAKLDGSGGGDLQTTGASLNSPSFPVLVKSPLATATPAITGGSAVGSVLTCGAASWAADLPGEFLYRAPQSTGFQWTLAGKDIAGATANTLTAFVPGSYGCRATASNVAGTTSQTSAAHTVTAPTQPKPTKAVMTALSETNATFTVASASTPLTGRTAAVRHKKGTVFSFRLDQAATVKLAIQANLAGRRLGRRCVAPTTALRQKPRCTRTVTIATLTRTAHTALNKIAFSGRISGKALKPGSYKAVFAATDASGSSQPKTLSFTIAKR